MVGGVVMVVAQLNGIVAGFDLLGPSWATVGLIRGSAYGIRSQMGCRVGRGWR